MKTPNMEKSKEESVVLLSLSKPMENNNTLENGDFHPFDQEKKSEARNGELQTFDVEKTLADRAEIKSKSQVPLVVAWVCVGCAITFVTIALVVILTRTAGTPGPPVPSNHSTSTVSPSTVSSTPVSSSSIEPSPTALPSSSIVTSPSMSQTVSTLQSSTSSYTSSSVSLTASLSSVSPTTSVLVSPTKTVSVSSTARLISTSSVFIKSSEIAPTKSTVISTSLSKNSVTTATVTVEITTPRPGCGSDEFQCASGQCIPKNLTCDGEAQCYDLSDEINCPNCRGFQCDSGLCLWAYSFRCNGRVDCPDLSDETSCPALPGYEECDNGLWVHMSQWCDGIDDCFDNSDETDCDGECHMMGEKLCPDNKTCVLYEWWCDGHFDCPGGLDEADCGECSSSQWQCLDHTCISRDAVCDGVIDCPSRDDELNCLELKDTGHLQQTSGLVLVKSHGQQLPVCSSDWSNDWTNHVCQHLGFESGDSYTTISASTSQSYMVVDSSRQINNLPQNKTVLAALRKLSTCSTSKVVSVSCNAKVCGERKATFMTPFIVGGSLSPLGKWPWVVSISYLGKDSCGGVLVGNNWVLTAAHCIVTGSFNYTMLPYNFEVTAGTLYRERSPDHNNDGHRQIIRVKKIYIHPNAVKLVTGLTDWDMALLQLSKPVVYGNYVQPVCLPSQSESFPTKSQCFLAGWGFINTQQETVNELREAKMRLWGDEDCRYNTVSGESQVNINSTVCAGYTFGLVSACQGDSGGPLMCSDTRGRWTVAGVMSSGSEGCDGGQFNQPNRFARVSSAADWINSLTQLS